MEALSMSTSFVRLLSRNFCQKANFLSAKTLDQKFNKKKNNIHIYKQLYPWKTLEEFSKFIADSVVYNKEGVIAINKPYGISIYPFKNSLQSDSHPEVITETLKASSSGEFSYSLQQTLPFLKSILQVKDLIIVKSTDRYSSGITLLATNEEIAKRISSSLKRDKIRKYPNFHFWTVNVGIPLPLKLYERVAIKLLQTDKNGDNKQPIIETSFSKRQIKRGLIIPAEVHYSTLLHSQKADASLVEISTNQRKWHFLRVYLTFKGAAVLGDNLYGSRVKWLFGKPINISSLNKAAQVDPILPKQLLHVLNVKSSAVSIIPTHLHLRRVNLQIKKTDAEIVITALPPVHFQWTCSQLGFDLNNEGCTNILNC